MNLEEDSRKRSVFIMLNGLYELSLLGLFDFQQQHQDKYLECLKRLV